jgi:3-dehydroquinate synthase
MATNSSNPDALVSVNTKPQYNIYFGDDILAHQYRDFMLAKHYTEAVIVADSNTAELFGAQVLEATQNCALRATLVQFPAGELNKTLETVNGLLAEFAKFGLTRSGVVIAVGGGVVGDTAGFAASIWLRGVSVIQMPTTLLAMVDSSIGGKTGVDLPCGKNLVGAFHHPDAVFSWMPSLQSLKPQDVRNGFAEVLKTAVIGDAALFARLVAKPDDTRDQDVVMRCAQIKAEIVAQDDHEHGLRKLLNLGHTAGHALEQLSHFEIQHGEAVGTGMILVAEAGVRAGITEPAFFETLKRVLVSRGYAAQSPYPLAQMLAVMAGDKKRAGAKITIVVPKQAGECILHTIPIAELAAFWGN